MKFTNSLRYTSLKSTLCSWHTTANDVVLLRVDFNVPLDNNTVLDDFKLIASLETMNVLLEQGMRIVLLTHIGRPQKYDPALSTKHLIPWLTTHGYNAVYAAQPNDIRRALTTTNVVLFENIRFFTHDIVPQLFQYADYYVDDAFGSVHRDDFSLVELPLLFSARKRTIGYLVERELHALSQLISNPANPFTVIIGGGKAHDKLPLIEQLAGWVDDILVCPTLSNTFAVSQGYNVGSSLVDTNALPALQKLLHSSTKSRLHIPTDYYVSESLDVTSLTVRTAHSLRPSDIIITIGPQTVTDYCTIINSANTIFFNGLPGFLNKPSTLQSAQELMKAMAHSKAYTVIGGGDSVAAARQCGLEDTIGFLSTGGGATLAFLSNKPLPALDIFIHPQKIFLGSPK